MGIEKAIIKTHMGIIDRTHISKFLISITKLVYNFSCNLIQICLNTQTEGKIS